MASKTDLKSLSDEELMGNWTKAGDEAAKWREVLTGYSKEHQRREREKQLRSAFGGLTEADVEFIQGLEPDPIDMPDESDGKGN